MTLNIVQITDCHFMEDPDAELKGVCTRQSFRKVLEAVTTRVPRIDRLVISGDLAHDEILPSYQALHEALDGWHSRLLLIPGNHDNRAAMRQVFGSRIHVSGGRNLFSESIGQWRLIGLDSHLPGEVPGELGEQQLSWLDGELSQHSSSHICLFVHHPPFDVGSSSLDGINLEDAQRLMQVVAKHPHVRAISCGHVHQEISFVDSSRLLLTTPATCFQFLPRTDSFEIDDALPGFRLLELFPDGRIRTCVERLLSI